MTRMGILLCLMQRMGWQLVEQVRIRWLCVREGRAPRMYTDLVIGD